MLPAWWQAGGPHRIATRHPRVADPGHIVWDEGRHVDRALADHADGLATAGGLCPVRFDAVKPEPVMQ